MIGGHTRAEPDAVARARQAVEAVGGEVGGIVDTLRQVADAAGQITQIALQTRLVAFNASVEAKRAGEAGRGFGVVADAVKDLAAKVETSSKDIMGTVGELDSRIERAGARDPGRATPSEADRKAPSTARWPRWRTASSRITRRGAASRAHLRRPERRRWPRSRPRCGAANGSLDSGDRRAARPS